MIPNHWYAVLESREIPRRRPVGVTRLGEKLVLWRTPGGELVCQEDLCPHRGAALSAGWLSGERVVCPFHGLEYDPSGRCCVIPANGAQASVPKAFHVRSLPVREAHGLVWVWWGEPRAELPPLPWFESINDGFSYATLRDHWAVHYTRAIENQLDAVHLPFVHKSTIGRGNQTLVSGPRLRWERKAGGSSDRMNIWVYNESDHGQAPRKPEELPDPHYRPQLQFQFPNIWHNWISDTVRVFAAFAPIDDENTMIYVRFYQSSVRLPVVRQLFNALANPFNALILGQDKRVVLTQRPVRTWLRMGEKLIQGDGPIVAYRRRREELQNASAS